MCKHCKVPKKDEPDVSGKLFMQKFNDDRNLKEFLEENSHSYSGTFSLEEYNKIIDQIFEKPFIIYKD